MESRIIFLLLVLVVSKSYAESPTNQVRFFDREGYQVRTINLAPDSRCIPLSDRNEFILNDVTSLITDSCIMLYTDQDCDGNSIQIQPTGLIIDARTLLGDKFNGFRKCNQEENVQVLFIGGLNLTGNILSEIDDLCGCQKMTRKTLSIDTNDKCVQLYEDSNCKTIVAKLEAGHSALSRDLTGLQMQSIAPCQQPLHCFKMTATVVKFEIQDSKDQQLHSQSNTQNFQMATKGRFINTGHATVTQEYNAKKSIQETTMIQRVKSLSTAHTVQVSAKVAFENKLTVVGIFAFDQSKLSASLSAAYTFNYNESSTDTERHVSSETREFQATQKIEIPPCTSYEIDSFVKFTQNYPISYTVYTEISATIGGERMLAEELESRLTDMVKIGKVDDYTINASATSFVTVDFGVETYVNGNSVKLAETACCNNGTDPANINANNGFPYHYVILGISGLMLVLSCVFCVIAYRKGNGYQYFGNNSGN